MNRDSSILHNGRACQTHSARETFEQSFLPRIHSRVLKLLLFVVFMAWAIIVVTDSQSKVYGILVFLPLFALIIYYHKQILASLRA